MAQLMTYQGGRVQWLQTDLSRVQYRTREEWLAALEQARRDGVAQRRAYYDGRQYDESNAKCLEELQAGAGYSGEEKMLLRAMMLWHAKLPEHLRLHEYSTQLQESVDFIANRLSHNARISVEDQSASTVIQTCLDASPELSGTDDDEDIVIVNVTREAIKVGDTPVLVRWDPQAGTTWLEFWDSEVPEMRFRDGRPDLLEEVRVEQIDWKVPPGETQQKPVTIRRIWSVELRVPDERFPVLGLTAPRMECAENVWLVAETGEQDDVLLQTIWWGVPFLPWWLIRGNKASLRATRGESLITDQAMKTADRYNAVEQVAWLIARYNSHANVGVVGDAALLQNQSKKLSRDVADVLVFPGGTDLEVLSLPTDPQMIEHQKQVLLDGMYGSMGVTRVDQTSLQGLGDVTGYALEILNQKSDGTFSKVKRQMIRDWKKLLNLVLDCTAYWSQGTRLDEVQFDLVSGGEDVAGAEAPADYESIDPETTYPNRAMDVEFGSGYIVDDAKIRDDFVAGLISLEQALRLKGYGDEEIKLVVEEQTKAKDEALQRQQALFTGSGEGTSSTSAGRATNNTTRRAG